MIVNYRCRRENLLVTLVVEEETVAKECSVLQKLPTFFCETSSLSLVEIALFFTPYLFMVLPRLNHWKNLVINKKHGHTEYWIVFCA